MDMEKYERADLLARLAPSGAEDFITEAFSWILERSGFGVFFLDRLKDEATDLPTIGAGCSWTTQTSYGLDGTAKRPDMICISADKRSALIFEHKVGADLHDGQLDSYRRIGRSEFKGGYGLVLITASRGQRHQNPDRHLLWSEVHGWLCDWLGTSGVDGIAAFVARNLLRLLEKRGLGPMEQINAEQLLTIPRARAAERRTQSLVSSVADHPFWQELVSRVPGHPAAAGERLYRQHKPKEGRCGLYLLGGGDPGTWSPGVFVGVMLDGSDHGPPSVNDEQGSGPEACLVVDIHKDHHGDYANNESYQRLVDTLSRQWPDNAESDYWRCHLGANPWHPVLVRKPLAAVFGRAATGDDQVQMYVEDVGHIAESILHLEELWDFRRSLA